MAATPRWRRLLREPLLHFLGLGAGIFALFAAVAGDDPSARRVVVEPGMVASLAATFQATWQRPPTPGELEGLVADHVREEILYREAAALGLDRDDVIVRRRMRQKMELLAESFGEEVVPVEAELEAWLREHPERYRSEARVSFRQVYLSPERGAALEADAERLLAALRADGASLDPAALGDRIGLPPALRDAPLSDVARHFGDGFAARLEAASPGEWTGPVESGYGAHLVRIESRVEGRLPELAEVREAVRRDWQSARTRDARERFYEALREGYDVRIEWPADTRGALAAGEPR
jgi:hypothetical protein